MWPVLAGPVPSQRPCCAPGVADEQELERVSEPRGLDIGAVSPAETALDPRREILARRAGREGGPLQKAAGSIHAGVD